jgi:UDP-glucose 4-epimerase
MLHVTGLGLAAQAPHRVEVFNLGAPEYCQVKDSIGWICEALKLQPRLEFSGGNRGWIGDNPFIFLDTKKITGTGWKAQLTIRDGILRTLRWLEANPWVFEKR